LQEKRTEKELKIGIAVPRSDGRGSDLASSELSRTSPAGLNTILRLMTPSALTKLQFLLYAYADWFE
jgi:hypothetical protein